MSFLSLQWDFWRTAWRERNLPPPADGLPMPPPRLRHRVHGAADRESYLAVGRRVWTSLETLLRGVGREPRDVRAVLDFGCGSGRVLRNIPRDVPGRAIVGVDIDPQGIAWCAAHLPGRFATIAPEPPTEFADGEFDFIFAISVFTHLDEGMQFRWLAELARLLAPGGVVIASVHGDYHRSLGKRRFDLTRGFCFTVGKTGLLKPDGLPDFYQDAQHTRAYVEREWTRFFTLLDYRERGISEHHDAVVLGKRS